MTNIKEAYETRNREIFILYKSGKRQKEIANLVGLSEGRVKKIIQAVKDSLANLSCLK
jgi:DNA-directed RNA polymerase specialized sigma subunit